MSETADAITLAQSMIAAGERAGKHTSAFITTMDQVINTHSPPISTPQCPSVPSSGQQYPSVPVSAHQCPSVPISAHQCSSVPITIMDQVISTHQHPSVPSSANQCQSVPISAHQCPSVPISAHTTLSLPRPRYTLTLSAQPLSTPHPTLNCQQPPPPPSPQPLGTAVGNWLEVAEAVITLRGEGPKDLEDLSVVLAGQMLLQAHAGGAAADGATAKRAKTAGFRNFEVCQTHDCRTIAA